MGTTVTRTASDPAGMLGLMDRQHGRGMSAADLHRVREILDGREIPKTVTDTVDGCSTTLTWILADLSEYVAGLVEQHAITSPAVIAAVEELEGALRHATSRAQILTHTSRTS